MEKDYDKTVLVNLKDTPNLVARFRLNMDHAEEFKMIPPRQLLNDKFIEDDFVDYAIVTGNVPQILEYEKDKIILVVS